MGLINVITDYEIGHDRVDLSGWNISSQTELIFAPQSYGIEIMYGQNILELRSANGRSISASELTHDMLFVADRPAIANRPSTNPDPNPPTPVPTPPEPVVEPEPVGPEGVNDNPEPTGPDPAWQHLLGGDSNDLLRGGTGDDTLLGERINPAFDDRAGIVVRLYQATFGREPDEAGFWHWMDHLQSGMSVHTAAAYFITSQEYQSRYGNVDTGDYIRKLYINALGRDAEPAGYHHWMNYLTNVNTERPVTFVHFSESQELRDQMLGRTAAFGWAALRADQSGPVYRLYQGLLDRAPDLGGFLHWTEQLANGMDYRTAMQYFLTSTEFTSRFGQTTNDEFVRLLYHHVHHREPDEAGYYFWMQRLNVYNYQREDVTRSFIDSTEFVTRTDRELRDWMRAQGENDRLVPGGGNNQVMGGIMSDTFVFDKGTPGKTRIFDFEPWDRIELNGFGYQSGTEAIANMRASGNDVVFSDGDVEITFANTALSDIQPDHFTFH